MRREIPYIIYTGICGVKSFNTADNTKAVSPHVEPSVENQKLHLTYTDR